MFVQPGEVSVHPLSELFDGLGGVCGDPECKACGMVDELYRSLGRRAPSERPETITVSPDRTLAVSHPLTEKWQELQNLKKTYQGLVDAVTKATPLIEGMNLVNAGNAEGLGKLSPSQKTGFLDDAGEFQEFYMLQLLALRDRTGDDQEVLSFIVAEIDRVGKIIGEELLTWFVSMMVPEKYVEASKVLLPEPVTSRIEDYRKGAEMSIAGLTRAVETLQTQVKYLEVQIPQVRDKLPVELRNLEEVPPAKTILMTDLYTMLLVRQEERLIPVNGAANYMDHELNGALKGHPNSTGPIKNATDAFIAGLDGLKAAVKDPNVDLVAAEAERDRLEAVFTNLMARIKHETDASAEAPAEVAAVESTTTE